jgi:hypothetical protein
MTVTLHLQIVGVLLLMLAAMNPLVIRHFGWRQEMRKVDLLARNVFFVHFAFIMMILVMFGVLSLAFTDALLQSGTLSRLVLAALTIFWGARLGIQLFGYNRKLWRGDRGKTIAHAACILVWSYFTSVYGWALAVVWSA